MILRKAAIFFLVGLVVALPSATVFGAIMAVSTPGANPPGTPFGAPEAALGAPWASYQLSFQATAGELIGAVEVHINGVHQRWSGDTNFDGEADPTPNGPPSNGRGDSHLTAPAGAPFGLGPSETNTKAGSPLTSTPGTTEYGIGGIDGAWGIVAPGPTTNIAYLVVNRDMLPTLDITVLAAEAGTGAPLGSFDEAAFGFAGGEVFPPVAVDVNLGDRIRGAIINHQFTTSAGTEPITWGSLQVAGPAGAVATNGPTLNANGAFSWASNIDDAGLGQWTFSATATNSVGSDVATLTVNLIVPEPATMSLFGLAMVGMVGFGLRKRS